MKGRHSSSSGKKKKSVVINGAGQCMSHTGLWRKVKAHFTELKAILSYGTPNQLGPKGA